MQRMPRTLFTFTQATLTLSPLRHTARVGQFFRPTDPKLNVFKKHLLDDPLVANVPLRVIEDVGYDPLYPHVDREMVMGIRAWTHGMSRLAKKFFKGDMTEHEKKLYQAVARFAQQASMNPLFHVDQKLVYRTTETQYCPPELVSLLREPPPMQKLWAEMATPYANPKDLTLNFAPVTSWTTHDITTKEGMSVLAKSYPSTLESTDIIFIARNAKVQNWGSIIGHLSLVEGENEFLTPPGRQARVTHLGHLKRPDIENYRYGDKSSEQKPGVFQFDYRPDSFVPGKVVHVVIIDFIEATK